MHLLAVLHGECCFCKFSAGVDELNLNLNSPSDVLNEFVKYCAVSPEPSARGSSSVNKLQPVFTSRHCVRVKSQILLGEGYCRMGHC